MDKKRKEWLGLDESNMKEPPYAGTKNIDVRMTGNEILDKYLKIEGIDWEQNFLEKAYGKKYNPTLYFEDEDGGEKVFCKKRIIFPLNKTLSDFADILRSNIGGNPFEKGITLHYVEGSIHVALSRCSQRF